jgi:hypothetical protein
LSDEHNTCESPVSQAAIYDDSTQPQAIYDKIAEPEAPLSDEHNAYEAPVSQASLYNHSAQQPIYDKIAEPEAPLSDELNDVYDNPVSHAPIHEEINDTSALNSLNAGELQAPIYDQFEVSQPMYDALSTKEVSSTNASEYFPMNLSLGRQPIQELSSTHYD